MEEEMKMTEKDKEGGDEEKKKDKSYLRGLFRFITQKTGPGRTESSDDHVRFYFSDGGDYHRRCLG